MTAAGLLENAAYQVRRYRPQWADLAIPVAIGAIVLVAVYGAWSYISALQSQAPSAELQQSIEQYRAALKSDPTNVAAMTALATGAMEEKQYKTAIYYWQAAIATVGGHPTSDSKQQLDQAYYGLGAVYLETRQYSRAATALEQALRQNAVAADTHYLLSVAYQRLGQAAKQLAELKTTVKYEPANAQASYDLGKLALAGGDVAAAAEYFRVAADNAPASIRMPQQELDKIAADGKAESRLGYAAILSASDTAAALTEARVAAALAPADADAVRLVGSLAEKQGDRDRALNAYKRLLEMRPADAEAQAAIKRLEADGK